VFHVAAHGVMKITLFFCAGAIQVRHRLDRVDDLAGLGRRMPVTMGAFTLGALGLAGMPLLAGFVSKWHLGSGALQASHPVFLVVLLVSGLLNFAYFFPIVRAAFFEGPKDVPLEEARAALWVPLALTAAAALVLGLAPDAALSFHTLAWRVAGEVVAGPVRLAVAP